jgi:hypothetical protein
MIALFTDLIYFLFSFALDGFFTLTFNSIIALILHCLIVALPAAATGFILGRRATRPRKGAKPTGRGFLNKQISIPPDFDRMGAEEIEKQFNGDG